MSMRNISWSKWFSYTLIIVAIPSLLISLGVEELSSMLGLSGVENVATYTLSLIISFSALSALMRKVLITKGMLTPSISSSLTLEKQTIIPQSFLRELEGKISKVDKEKEPERYVHLASVLGISYLQNAITLNDKELFIKANSMKEEVEKFIKCHKIKPEAKTIFDGFKGKVEQYKSSFLK